MAKEYSPVDEVAWQRKWDEAQIFECGIREDRPKFYCLEMYPYPSGKMHMGHVRNYSIGDAVARYKRMMGFDVLYPIGFDSFGMPAENAAMDEGGHPYDITERNMASITQQIKRMGFSYDWKRQLKSHDPRYYKWNQYYFTKFYEQGLAYQEYAPVNWCEQCETVLANEQVKAGRCWRCNGPVVQKEMEQWFLNINKYAQELVDGLDTIAFPENVKSLQRDWLGRSEGAEITFEVEGKDLNIEVFTTRPDTLFGVTFVTLAPEHPMAEQLVKGTEYESAWQDLYDEVSVMAEFDRIRDMRRRKVYLLDALLFTLLPENGFQFGLETLSSPHTVQAQLWPCRVTMSVISISRRRLISRFDEFSLWMKEAMRMHLSILQKQPTDGWSTLLSKVLTDCTVKKP